MSRKQYSLSKQLAVAMALALCASRVAIADESRVSWFGADNSMNRLGGDGYAYFSQPLVGNTTTSASWRRNYPNGLTERDLQRLSTSSLAASTHELDSPNLALASAPADPSWRPSHPNGLTERELQAAGASSMAMWQVPNGAGVAIAQSNVAQSPGKEMSLARK